VLLDFPQAVVHVFYDQARQYYKLEKLWGDAHLVTLDALGVKE
jgi:ribosome-associated protein